MRCKNCGTEIDFSKKDEEGIVTCPTCGKKYKLKLQPEEPVEEISAQEAFGAPEKEEKPRTVAVPAATAKAPAKIDPAKRNMYIAIAGCAVLAVALIIVLIVTLGGNKNNDSGKTKIVEATTPKELVNLLQKTYDGDAQAAWYMMSPYKREEYYSNNYTSFRKEFESEYKELKEYYGGSFKIEIKFQHYDPDETYSVGEYYDNRTEEGYVYYGYKRVDNKYGRTEDSDRTIIIKVDGKWYAEDIPW